MQLTGHVRVRVRVSVGESVVMECLLCATLSQIGIEKHRMLELFMQVPTIVTTRLAKRCEEIYTCTKTLKELQESEDASERDGMEAESALQQVRVGSCVIVDVCMRGGLDGAGCRCDDDDDMAGGVCAQWVSMWLGYSDQ